MKRQPRSTLRSIGASLAPVVAACALIATAPARAAGPDDDDWPSFITATVNDAMTSVMAGFDEASFDFAADELGGERVVKGAPYCADAIHESIQTLTDGNRIVRKQQSRLCRDGEGRTRQEVDRDGRKLVWLRDPVAKQAWLLDPTRKTARKVGLHGHGMGFHDAAFDAANAEAWREYADRAREQARAMADKAREQANAARERAREQGREPGRGASGVALPAPAVQPVPAAAPAPVIITRGAPGNMEVQVVRLGEDGKPAGPGQPGGEFHFDMPMPPPAIRWHAMRMAPRGPGATSALGSKDIEGLRSNGERTSWTIEAGKVGNEKPIVITREVWTSPDLLLTVLSRDADPRSGEAVYRLANVKRGEPEAALMKVPADYAAGGGAASAPQPLPAPVPRKPATPPTPPKAG